MTDEEMAEDSFNCKKLLYKSSTDKRSYKDGFLAGLKVGRPEWHDLRKDPNDLPKVFDKPYICKVYSHFEVGYFTAYKDQPWHFDEYYLDNETVIAWCEIPTFTDKE